MPTLVQSATATGTSGTSVTATFGSSTTAGNTIIVYVGEFQSTSNPTVSGITLTGSSDTFTSESFAIFGTNAGAEIWADVNCAGGHTAVVTSFTAGTGATIAYDIRVEEWSGLATSGSVDQANSNNGSSTSWTSDATGTLANANELVVGNVFIHCASTPTLTGPGGSWTNTTAVTASTGNTMITGHEVVSATTAQTYNGTSTVTGTYGACIVTFKEAGITVSITEAVIKPTAQPVGISNTTTLSAAIVKVAAGPITPVYGPPVSAAIIKVAAQPITPSGGVGISAAIIKTAAGSITPEVIEPQLIISICPVACTDPILGQPVQQGVVVYDSTGQYTQLVSGALFVSPAGIGSGLGGSIDTEGPGTVIFNSGGTTPTDTQTNIELVSADANNGSQTLISLEADVIALNSSAVDAIPYPAAGITTLAELVTALTNVGILH